MVKAKGFATWNPHKKTERVLEDIEAVLEEYEAHLPLTIRQIFYRLVGKGYEKTEDFYERVANYCARARRSGRIKFWKIRDDGISRQGGEWFATYQSPQEYYETHEELLNNFHRSWHDDQPSRVMVLCEAAGMVPLLSRAVGAYRVPVVSCGKFDSVTAKYDLFTDAVNAYTMRGQTTTLLHFGDHDASGYFIHQSLEEDLAEFCEDSGQPELFDVRRVALTKELIADKEIIPDLKQPSLSDRSSQKRAFVRLGLLPAAQLEAVPPDTLSDLAREAVEDALDLDVLAASQQRERQERQEVQEKLGEVNEVLREAFGLR